MAIALEGVDLVAICAVLLLIGLLIAVRYTFVQLAQILDVDVAGYHPFHGVASGIENVIVAGLNDGIGALEHVATTLWHWSSVAIATTVAGLLAFVHDVGRSITWLHTVGIPDAIRAVTDPLTRVATAAHTLAADALAAVKHEITAREQAIAAETTNILGKVAADLHALQSTIEGAALTEFPQLARDVAGEIQTAVHGVEVATNLTASTLAGAAEEALTNAERVGALTAEELRQLLGNLKAGNVASLIASIPVIAAAVSVLEAETGLGNAECRGKVKGICATPATSWLRFLERLALTAAVADIHELIALFEDATKVIVDAVEPLFTA